MEALTIKTFKPDKISAISADQPSGEFNYTSVKCIRWRRNASDTYRW